MKHAALFFLLIVAISSKAQTVTSTVSLTQVKKLRHIDKVPFDSVKIFDNRLDQKLSIGSDGIHGIYIRKLDSPATMTIKKYIEMAIAPLSKEHRKLYINIKQLRFENPDAAALFFSADAYFLYNDGFRKIATIKNAYFKDEIRQALNDMIEKVAANNALPGIPDNKIYTLSDINSNITDDWKSLTIMQQANFPAKGIYESIADLNNNTFIPAGLALRTEADSSYTLWFTNEKDQKKWDKFYDIYAICCDGRLYLRIMNNFFLPLSKTGNKLCFHVPLTLPNMSAIFAARDMVMTDNTLDLSNTKNIEALFIGALVNLIIDNKSSIRYEKDQQTVAARGKADATMRDCVLDLDNGDIIY
jgi:hypothetical protein